MRYHMMDGLGCDRDVAASGGIVMIEVVVEQPSPGLAGNPLLRP